MKIAILGGGITGLTAAHTLSKNGHTVELFEKSKTLGGLAQGFRAEGWDWPLEYAYHHLFANDSDILSFADEVGFGQNVFFKVPETNSLYHDGTNYRIFPVDSPQNFLMFPLLGPVEKVRAAVFLAIMKFLPMLPIYEKISAEAFVREYMGERMWKVFFQELFRKKFGKYAGKVLAAFLWARIHKRTQRLGYFRGGFQSFVDHVVKKTKESGATLHTGVEIGQLKRTGEGFILNGKHFDAVISTLPSSVLARVAKGTLSASETKKLSSLSFLHARVLILETDKPILSQTYWLNVCTPKIPTMIVGQHTNFVDKKFYGGNHIAYVGWYDEQDSEVMKASEKTLLDRLLPHLHDIEGSDFVVKRSFSFVGPFAQPIFDKAFLKNKPDFVTSIPGLYIANLDMTYPYDRGTNYAVKLGKEVCNYVVATESSGIVR